MLKNTKNVTIYKAWQNIHGFTILMVNCVFRKQRGKSGLIAELIGLFETSLPVAFTPHLTLQPSGTLLDVKVRPRWYLGWIARGAPFRQHWAKAREVQNVWDEKYGWRAYCRRLVPATSRTPSADSNAPLLVVFYSMYSTIFVASTSQVNGIFYK